MKKLLGRLLSSVSRFLLWDLVRDRRTRPLFIWVGALIFVGTAIFHWLEDWSWVDSFYFSVISLATVGYGDFVPTTTISKLLAVFYVLNGIGVLVAFLDTAAEVRKERLNIRKKEEKIEEKG